MISLDVGVYNEKKDTEKVKVFGVDQFNDGEGDMVEISLGKDSFIINYETWKLIGRVIEAKKYGLFEYKWEDCVNG